MDEGRFGRISVLRSCWAPAGVRPRVPRQVVRESLYAFAAVCPLHAEGFATISPRCNTDAMSRFLLDLFARWPDERLLINPVEHIWDEVREKRFANRLFPDLDAVEARLKTELGLLLHDPQRLRSLTCFPWIDSGFSYL